MLKISVSKKQLREFGFLIGFGFPIIIGWLHPLISGHHFRLWTMWVGLASIFFGIFKPYILFYPYKGWMALGHILGWINSRIILGLVFIIVLLPIALIMRLFGYDPMRKKKFNLESYKENNTNHRIDLTKIF